MQCDRLWPDHASIIQNREVSLIRRSSKMANRLGPSMTVRITEVSLIRKAVIERFHCMYL